MAKSNASSGNRQQGKNQNASHGTMKNKSAANERPRDSEGRFTSKGDMK